MPLMEAFIKECQDRRSWSKNEKAYFKGGLHHIFDLSWTTFKRWKIVSKHPKLQEQARHGNLTNDDIEAFEAQWKKEQKKKSK